MKAERPQAFEDEMAVDNPAAKNATEGAASDDQMATSAAASLALQAAAFGGADGVEVEDEATADARYRAQWGGILHPETRVRHAYDMMQLIVMLWLGYILPLRLAFNKGASGPFLVFLDVLIDGTVWVDMFFQMKMYYRDSNTKRLVTDQKKIRRAYMRQWFFVDFFSVVPLDQILFATGTIMLENTQSEAVTEWGFRLLEWSVAARMMRLLRLVRLAKLKQLFKVDSLVDSIYAVTKRAGVTKLQVAFYFRLLFLLSTILATGHFLGCIWLMIGRENVLALQNPTGWMVSAYDQGSINETKDYIACSRSDFDASEWNAEHGSTCKDKYKCAPIPKENPYDVDCSWIRDREKSLGGTGYADKVGAHEDEQYLSAFYFSVVTITTVGYGDILPETPGEKRFVCSAIILGAFLYAFIIGEFSNLLSNLSQDRDAFDAKMRSVNNLLAHIEAPVEIRSKIQAFYDYKHSNKEGPADIIDELPMALQVAVVKQKYGRLISKVPFFSTLNDRDVTALCRKMTSFTVAPDDFIMVAGQSHDELLILSRGVARLAAKSSEGRTTMYEAGTFWGEMQFLGLQKKRTLTVVADLFCEVASIEPSQIVAGSEVHERLKRYGEMRQAMEKEMSQGKTVDVQELMLDFNAEFSTVGEDDRTDSSQELEVGLPSRIPQLDGNVLELLQQFQYDTRDALQRQQKALDTLADKVSAMSQNLN